MKRYLIEDVKCDATDGGIACGPVPGHVVASVKFNDGTKSQWLTVEDVEGFYFYLSDEDIFEHLRDEDYIDDNPEQYIDAYGIDSFDGFDLGAEYEVVENILTDALGDEPHPAVPLLRYLILVDRCEWDDLDGLKQMGIGHYADELDIPASDLEEDASTFDLEFNEEWMDEKE